MHWYSPQGALWPEHSSAPQARRVSVKRVDGIRSCPLHLVIRTDRNVWYRLQIQNGGIRPSHFLARPSPDPISSVPPTALTSPRTKLLFQEACLVACCRCTTLALPCSSECHDAHSFSQASRGSWILNLAPPIPWCERNVCNESCAPLGHPQHQLLHTHRKCLSSVCQAQCLARRLFTCN